MRPAHPLLVLAAIWKAGVAGADRNASVSQQLRYDLLGKLDPKVPPTTLDMIGTQIHVQYRIFKVLSVDVATGRLVLKVWRRAWWFDERLKFDPADYGGLETIEAYPRAPNLAFDSPDNRLWLPHIMTYNSITSEETTLEYGAAWIRHDGRVWHSVPGAVDVTCRFSGLAAFPRDTLSCPMEIASWSLPDTVTNLTFFSDPTDEEALAQGDRGCAEISAQSASAASSYQEFQIDRVECLKYTRFYPCCATTPWTQLWINIYVKRAGFYYYTRLIEVPSIMLACLSFAAFFLHPPSAGEAQRIGFGSTIVLTQLVLMTFAGDKLPTCGELLWIDVLLSLNVIFTFVALLESCYVTYIGMNFQMVSDAEAKQKAETVDSIARWTILPMFLVLLSFAYNMHSVEDGYSIDPCPSGVCPVTIGGKELGTEGLKYLPPMVVGFGGWIRVSIKWGVGLLVPLVLLAVCLAWQIAGKAKKIANSPEARNTPLFPRALSLRRCITANLAERLARPGRVKHSNRRSQNGRAKDAGNRVQPQDLAQEQQKHQEWKHETKQPPGARKKLTKGGSFVRRLEQGSQARKPSKEGANQGGSFVGSYKNALHPWRLEQVDLPLGQGDHVDRWSTTTHNNRSGAPRARPRPPPPPPGSPDVPTPAKGRGPFPWLRNSASSAARWGQGSLRRGWSGRDSAGEDGAGESSVRYSA